MDRRWNRVAAAVMLTAVTSATACGAHRDPLTTITVYAASSLIKPFTEIGKQFQAANPGYSVEFVFAGSSDLSSALTDDAEADVFASVDATNMTAVADAGLVSGTAVPFAANRLVVVTPAGNPAHISSFADLGRPGLRVAVCAPDGACGSATQRAEQRAGLRFDAAIPETTAAGVLADVTSGRADAGVVFMTDAPAGGSGPSWFALPGDVDDVTSWITVVKGTGENSEATQFVQQVTGAAGKQTLAKYGFTEPVRNPAG